MYIRWLNNHNEGTWKKSCLYGRREERLELGHLNVEGVRTETSYIRLENLTESSWDYYFHRGKIFRILPA